MVTPPPPWAAPGIISISVIWWIFKQQQQKKANQPSLGNRQIYNTNQGKTVTEPKLTLNRITSEFLKCIHKF